MNAPPSIDPANLDSLTGAFKSIFNKLIQSLDGALPARVVSATRQYAQVQPLISIVSTSGQRVTRAPIARVPIVQIGGGGFVMSFNISAGDLGFIIASDRDISLFLQSLAEASPNTNRIKNFADSFFIPSVLAAYTTAGEDSNAAIIQSLDGSVKISLNPGQIKIAAPSVVIESANAQVNADNVVIESNNATITAGSSFSITTPTLAVTGNITATGSITPGV